MPKTVGKLFPDALLIFGGKTQLAGDAAGMLAFKIRCADILLLAGVGLLAFWLRHSFVFPPGQYLAAILLGIVLHQFCAQILDCYGQLRSGPAVTRFLSALLIAVAVLVGVAFFAKLSDEFSRLWLFNWVFSTVILGTLIRCLLFFQAATDVALGRYRPKILLIAKGPLPDAAEATVEITKQFSPAEALEALPTLLEDVSYDEIVLVPPFGDSAEKLFALAQMASTRVRVQLDPVFVGVTAHNIDHLGLVPTIDIVPLPLSGVNLVVKRLEDVCLGTLMLLAALPVLLLAAVAIRFEDGGPILFSQQRRGVRGRVFGLLKLRTMRVSERLDAQVPQTALADPRVTRVGRFLRRWSIDELPQLLNVLNGDMSLVGPRPHALPHENLFAQQVKNYTARRKMKPGMTGLAQVSGFRGAIRSPVDIEGRIRLDLEYIARWSLGLDLHILLATIWAVVRGKGAY